MKIRFRNYLDNDSVMLAFENDITLSMLQNAVKYDIENNIGTLEETSYCYFTPYNNVINIRYEVMDISDNKVVIDIIDFYIDNSYSNYIIDTEIDNFKDTFNVERNENNLKTIDK